MSSATAPGSRQKPYHHGSLRSALIDAGVDLAREGGPERVILREAARVAGVSHSAAYRHFADREALLAEVSRAARGELAAQMQRGVAAADHPIARLGAVGTAYVRFALDEPGLFRVAFTSHPATDGRARTNRSTGEDGSPAVEPYEILEQVLDEVQAIGLLDETRRPGAAIAAWSAVHGLAGLLVDGPLPTTPEGIEFALEQVLGLIARGLLGVDPEAAR